MDPSRPERGGRPGEPPFNHDQALPRDNRKPREQREPPDGILADEFRKADTDRDQRLRPHEVPLDLIERFDADKDHALDFEEFKVALQQRGTRGLGPSPGQAKPKLPPPRPSGEPPGRSPPPN